jgi:hypothetical protein
MENVVTEVCGGVGARLREQNEKGANVSLKPDCVSVKTEAPQGAWRVGIPAVCKGEAGFLAVGNRIPMMSFVNPAIIENFGNSVRWVFLTQKVSEQERPYVEKELEDRKKSLAGEFRDVQVEVTPLNGAYAVVAVIPVAGRLDRDAVLKRLNFFASQGYFTACDVFTGHEKARMDNWKRLKGTKLTRLSNDEVVLLNPVLQEDDYSVKGSEGYWRMQWDEYHVGIINSDTMVTLGVSVAYPKPGSDAKVFRTDTLMREWIQKNRFKSAAMSHSWDGKAGRLWVLASIPYPAMTGSEFMDTVKDFYKDWAKDKQKPIRRLLDDNLR